MRLSRPSYIEVFHAVRDYQKRSQSRSMLPKAFFVLVCYFLSASAVLAERYSVERDSFGNFSAKKVEVAPAQAEDKKQEEHNANGKANKAAVDPESPFPAGQSQGKQTQADTDSLSDAKKAIDQKSKLDTRELAEEKLSTSSDQQIAEEQEPRKLSIFEKKYLEAELAERERILKAIKSAEGAESDYDATEVNPEDFIDSEVLLRSADKQVKERSPYYVTVDADGRTQTTFYDPTLVKEILFLERNKKIEYTDAQVYKDGESDVAIPESADPVALSILSAGKDQFVSYFEKFSTKCCDQLPNIQTPQITTGNYHYFVLNEDSLPYRFAEGDSRFLLLRLPDLDQAEIPIRIRTFIRRFSDQNIERGVFFPQIITLDINKEPLRIITGPLLKYQEETWTTHAYLQGIFALSQTPDMDERYLLINTTRETLDTSSSIDVSETKKGSARTVTLQHMNEGSFEIEILQ